jgi:hypothetical protein
MTEKQFEDILFRYPELIEEGLQVMGRQVNIAGKYVDMILKDRHGSKLIVEIKKGAIERKDMAQLLDYEGYLLSPDDPTVRVMLVGNRVPENIRRALVHHGFEWKEIREQEIKPFLIGKNDTEMLVMFSGDIAVTEGSIVSQKEVHAGKPPSRTPFKAVSTDLLDKFWDIADRVMHNAITSNRVPNQYINTLIKRKGRHNKRDGYLSLRLCFGRNIESGSLMSALASIGVYYAHWDKRVPIDPDIVEFDKDYRTHGIITGTEIATEMINFITPYFPEQYRKG